MNNPNANPSRRAFMGTLAAGATGLFSAIPQLSYADPTHLSMAGDADEWFNKVKGKHRIAYDATEPNEGFPIAWAAVFYMTNNKTGTPDNELTAVVVLRHNGAVLAMQDNIWEKYKFGENFKVNDPVSNLPATTNPFNVPKSEFWTTHGIDGIRKLTERGVMFCVCDIALTVMSGFMGPAMNMKPEDVKQEWVNGLLPGIQIVPSGVWALGRAQEKGCAYCYAGG
jgi:intracellular sulfur oxidation DsrE/DsrF family protein